MSRKTTIYHKRNASFRLEFVFTFENTVSVDGWLFKFKMQDPCGDELLETTSDQELEVVSSVLQSDGTTSVVTVQLLIKDTDTWRKGVYDAELMVIDTEDCKEVSSTFHIDVMAGINDDD